MTRKAEDMLIKHATQSVQGQDLLTVRVPGITGEARRLLMGWKVAAGTPATVFTITFPLTVAESRPGLNVRF